MPHILLKRTFKEKERKNEKALSFHGANLPAALIQVINERCAMCIKYSGGSKLLTFTINREGHYYASMNHDFQKNHEEDAIALILDVMEEYGWSMKTQYSAFCRSEKGFSQSETQRDIFVFHQGELQNHPPATQASNPRSVRSVYGTGIKDNNSVTNIRFE